MCASPGAAAAHEQLARLLHVLASDRMGRGYLKQPGAHAEEALLALLSQVCIPSSHACQHNPQKGSQLNVMGQPAARSRCPCQSNNACEAQTVCALQAMAINRLHGHQQQQTVAKNMLWIAQSQISATGPLVMLGWSATRSAPHRYPARWWRQSPRMSMLDGSARLPSTQQAEWRSRD